jgi:hypothetical protein
VEQNMNPNKPVIQIPHDKKIPIHVYSSAHAAARLTGLNYSHIQDACHGRRCGVGKAKWRYATIEEIELYGIEDKNNDRTV